MAIVVCRELLPQLLGQMVVTDSSGRSTCCYQRVRDQSAPISPVYMIFIVEPRGWYAAISLISLCETGPFSMLSSMSSSMAVSFIL